MIPSPAESRGRSLSWALIVAANLALCALVILSPKHPVYDEGWWLDTLGLLRRDGLSLEFLRELPGAAGPTFTLVFAAVDRLVGLQFPWLRFVNVVLLTASVGLIWGVLALAGAGSGKAERRRADLPLFAASIGTLPTVGVSAGLAVTETPAFFFIAAGLLLLTLLMQMPWRPWSAALAVACALCIATAILGRQNYLVMLPCLLLALHPASDASAGHDALRLSIVFAGVALLVGPVFWLWGGLVPPQTAQVESGISLANGVRSAGYAGIIVVLLAPQVYRVLAERKLVLVAIAAACIPASLLPGQQSLPLASVSALVLGSRLAAFAGPIVNYILALSALAFVVCFAYFLWQRRMDWLTRFCGGTALIGILTNAKIPHQFSSRYVFVFLPFLAISVAAAARPNWHQPLRIALGACISLGALASYFFSQ